MGSTIGLQDAQHMSDMIRQESALAVLRRPRALRPEHRDGRIVQYREKAEELRAIAEDVILEKTRTTLLSLAGTYDNMARALEALPRNGIAAPDSMAHSAA
jgi:hypothetical protein